VSFALDHVTFDEFVWRDGAGRVHFASQRQLPIAKRHRDRVWPALSRYKRPRARKTDAWRRRRSSVSGIKTTCSIEKAAMLSVLRRWCPDSRLDAWHMAACDHAQRPPRYDPW
jgi:hypothetical protein